MADEMTNFAELLRGNHLLTMDEQNAAADFIERLIQGEHAYLEQNENLLKELESQERDLAAANARAEQNEKDAERYRWLRVQQIDKAEVIIVNEIGLRVCGWKESMDRDIDAAIAAKEKP